MLGDSIFNYRFQDKVLWEVLNENLGTELYPILPDTFELSGKDEDSLYWRDIVVGEISIGYVNVPSSNKTFYDSCLNSYAIKAKTATAVKGFGYKGFIFDKEHYIWGFPPENGRYTLNKKEIAQAEKLLRETHHEIPRYGCNISYRFAKGCILRWVQPTLFSFQGASHFFKTPSEHASYTLSSGQKSCEHSDSA